MKGMTNQDMNSFRILTTSAVINVWVKKRRKGLKLFRVSLDLYDYKKELKIISQDAFSNKFLPLKTVIYVAPLYSILEKKLKGLSLYL